jgi:glycosyltransferase involved in cell wall biosynthesis
MKKITIITPCFNEEANVVELYRQVKLVCNEYHDVVFDHLFIDNASTDKTVELIKGICAEDDKVKLIVNARNFGHIRSPYHGLMEADGDACIFIVADLQDPPELIKLFVNEWISGTPIVIGVKTNTKESPLLFGIRKAYYNLINHLSDTKLVKNYTGFGLYDRSVIEILRGFDDPYPYFRGLVMEIGFDVKQIEYIQPVRHRGISKNNFYSLYDIAMLGITSNSMIPLRLATFFGFFLAIVSLFISIGYLVYKILYWDRIILGVAPMIVGGFFMFSVILFFIGILGEYIINLQRLIQKRPHVIEKERFGNWHN